MEDYGDDNLINCKINHDCNLKILILGCGSIGNRHAKNLKSLGIKELVLCDKNHDRLNSLGKIVSSDLLYDDYELAVRKNPDILAAMICTPTIHHMKPAIYFAKNKINLFIEKPLSNTLSNSKMLSKLVSKNRLLLMMGHAFMFDTGLMTLKSLLEKNVIGKSYFVTYLHGQYLPDWHPKTDYRIEYTAKKNLGGGALLTLGSHSFYLMEWLFGKIDSIHGKYVGKIGDLEVDVDDCVFLLLKTNKKTIVQIQNNFTSRIYQHRMVVEGKNGNIECNFIKKKIFISFPNKKIKMIKITGTSNDKYVQELKYFLSHIRKNKIDDNLDLNSGIRFLKMIKTL